MTRRPKALPRLSREGWEPAGPARRVRSRSGMLCPKPEPRDEPDNVVVPRWAVGEIAPDERIALAEIAATGDVVQLDGTTYIVAPISPRTMDALAAFEADLVDREPEPDDSDGSLLGDCDLEEWTDEKEPDQDASISTPEFDPDKPVSRPTRVAGTLG